MRKDQDSAVEALVEQLIEGGSENMATVFAGLFNLAMRIERERFLGAGHYERTPERRGYANGTRPKKIDTPAGTVRLEVPKTAGHEAPFYPQALERGRRSCRAVMLAVAEMYIKGVSTRDAEAVMREFGLESLSSSQVSRAAKLLDGELDAWRNRPLGEIRYLLLDARYEKVREGGVVRDAAVLSVIGIGPDQRRRVLGVSCALSEAEVHWRAFLETLVARGMPVSPISFPMIIQASAPRARPSSAAPSGSAVSTIWLKTPSITPPTSPSESHRQGAAPGLERRRRQGRRGRAGPSGGGLPRQRPQARRLAGDGDPRGPRRLRPARAPPKAHANLEPHGAIHPAGDQAPHRKGQGLSQRGLARTSGPPSSSKSTRNGKPPKNPTSLGKQRMTDQRRSEFPHIRLLNRSSHQAPASARASPWSWRFRKRDTGHVRP